MNNVFCDVSCSRDGLASMLSEQLLGKKIEGIWHTSVHVHQREYWFGHGMQCGKPMQTQFGKPKDVLCIGTTEVDEALFKQFLDEIHPRFNVGTYNLLEHNCNNFSDECCEFLCGKRIPEEIVALPSEVLQTPFGNAIKPMLKMMEERMRNTTGQTVFAEDSDAISEGRSNQKTANLSANLGQNQPSRSSDSSALQTSMMLNALQAFASSALAAQQPSSLQQRQQQQPKQNQKQEPIITEEEEE